MISMTTLGEYVRDRRTELGLTVTALAESAELSKSEISALERGRIGLPGADKRRRLAAALGVSHLDVLIAAGEITAAEIEGKQGVVRHDPTDPLQQLIAAAERVPNRELLRGVTDMLKAWRKDGT